MSVGRQPGKPGWLATVVNLSRPHCQTVGASRMERSAARQVNDIVEWTKVLRCEFVQDFLNQNGNLVPRSLRHAQPVEADKHVLGLGLGLEGQVLGLGLQCQVLVNNTTVHTASTNTAHL